MNFYSISKSKLFTDVKGMPPCHLNLSESCNQYLRPKNLGHTAEFISLVSCRLTLRDFATFLLLFLSNQVCAARALKSKTMREVLDKLQDIYLIYGAPKVIRHDQGKEFASKVDKSVTFIVSFDFFL